MELKSKCLLFFYLNINSLKNVGSFNHLINELKLEFEILGISESRILKSQSLNTNVKLQNYAIKQTSTWIKLNQVLLKLFYPKKETWLLDVFKNIHAWIYTHLMTLHITLILVR